MRMTEALLMPARLYNAMDVLARPSVVPASAGVYAWYFNAVPPLIDAEGCHQIAGLALLYVGISPKEAGNGGKPSGSTLRRRLRTHYAGNAEGSTLRLTLGCLLAMQLGIGLRRVGSGGRYTFTNPGEQLLDQWMREHAFVTWKETARPWEAEEQLLSSGLKLPLNLAGNPKHDERLKELRSTARRQAKLLEIVTDSGGPRKRLGACCIRRASDLA